MHPVLRRTALVLGATLLTGLVGPAQGADSTPATAPAGPTVTPVGRPATPAEPLTAVHGARGIGDPYFPLDGNGGYDVGHYDIHDTYRVRAGDLTGWTVLTARATEDLASFSLDLVLDPRAVSVDGLPATYAKDGRHELVVTPAAPVTAGSTFRVRVDYTGRPRDTGWQGQRPFLADRTEAMAMNEPHVAPWWFPANDHPTDKATFDIAVRVPAGQQVLSNGEQVGRTDTPVWTTWHWRMRRPMSTYLAFFAAGRFRVERGTSNGLPWVNAVSRGLYPKDQDQQLRLLRSTPGIVAWLETQLGDYPFDSTGGVVTALFTGFALENQGRPTYAWLGGGPQARSTVVHELAHQWFGDQVSVRRWRDIWLNEGFASWVEWRYDETHGGRTAMSRLRSAYAARPARDPFWRLEIGRPGPAHLFEEPVYDRGAMALEALRQRLGTATFLRLLRTWVAVNAYDSATVEEFEARAEQMSGQELGGFFTAWLRSGTRPADTVANGLR